ncbi:MAG: Fur family transcriptional regulator [Oleibacter sp.]|nr:Fur family transcriptional regulator [Thalassolituus sp.]
MTQSSQDNCSSEQDSHKTHAKHNHDRCIATALNDAVLLCEQRGARLTQLRQRVLELVWQTHKPVGAYELLPLLAKEGFNSAPPTVYRALDFLLELGLVHRISSINAFIGCNQPKHEHPNGFFICRQCGNASELPALQLRELAKQLEASLGITIEGETHELTGLCASCSSKAQK